MAKVIIESTIVIPIIDNVKQNKIKRKIDEINIAREKPRKLIQKSKKAVEMAIEFGEEKTIEFLNKRKE